MATGEQEEIELGDENLEMYEDDGGADDGVVESIEDQQFVTLDGNEEGNQAILDEENVTAEAEEAEVEQAEPSVEHTEDTEHSDHGDKSSRKRSRSASTHKDQPHKDDFEDYELDSEIDESAEKDETVDDPDEEERNILHMPSLRSVMADVGHLKQERRVMVHALSYEELSHPAMMETVNKDTCEELKLHFVRPKDNPNEWKGFVTMHFMSSRAAKESVETLKTIREDLTIQSEDGAAYPRFAVDHWAKEEKGQKRWTDTLLYIKNVGENVTEDQLREVFTDAEDIVIQKIDSKKETKKPRIAYAVYRTSELARQAAVDYGSRVIELDGLTLKVYRYRMPIDSLPHGLLKLYERRVVLKYLQKLNETIDSATEDQKAPDWCSKRQKMCDEIIERDTRHRQSLGLSVPDLADLRQMTGLKKVKGADRKDLLIRLGVIERPRRSYHRDRDYHRDHSPDRKKSYGGYRSNKPKSLLGMPPPSLLNLPAAAVVPMSLMMQQNMFMSGMMNQMMSSGRRTDSSNKVLRLDASGNFHLDYNKDRQRHGSSGRDDRSRLRSSPSRRK